MLEILESLMLSHVVKMSENYLFVLFISAYC